MDEWIGGWMNGWMDGRMDGRSKAHNPPFYDALESGCLIVIEKSQLLSSYLHASSHSFGSREEVFE